MDITELKEKYPEQMKWLAKEFYKAYMHEGYKNIYNYILSKGESAHKDKYKTEFDRMHHYSKAAKIVGPEVAIYYLYTDISNKKLIVDLKGKKILEFWQSGFGDGNISDKIEEWLNKYHEKNGRFSEEQINEWSKYADMYYAFFVNLYKKINTQIPQKVEQVFNDFKQALRMPTSKAEETFPKRIDRGNEFSYPLFDYGFKFAENIGEVDLCYDWTTKPMVRYRNEDSYKNNYFDFNEAGFKEFKEFFEYQLERKKVGGYKSESTLRRENIKAEILAKAKERANFKEEILRLSN